MSQTQFVVGLDAGASKNHLLAEHTALDTPVEHRGAAANPGHIGIEAAGNVLVNLIKRAMQDVPAVEQLAICAGVAGAGRRDDQQALAERLRSAFEKAVDSVSVEVVSDALIALDAAYDGNSGSILIAGTGSMVLARTTTGDRVRAGGWGHVLGDDGSGHALGRAGLRAVAAAFDGGRETALRSRVCSHFDLNDRDDLLRQVYHENVDVAAVAPLVLDAAAQGDDVAADLLSAQVAGLADQVTWLHNRTEAIASRLTLLGGLLQNEHYARCLRKALNDRVPDWTIERLQDEPVVGALRRAHRLPLASQT